jgi:hypothetical protein
MRWAGGKDLWNNREVKEFDILSASAIFNAFRQKYPLPL